MGPWWPASQKGRCPVNSSVFSSLSETSLQASNEEPDFPGKSVFANSVLLLSKVMDCDTIWQHLKGTTPLSNTLDPFIQKAGLSAPSSLTNLFSRVQMSIQYKSSQDWSHWGHWTVPWCLLANTEGPDTASQEQESHLRSSCGTSAILQVASEANPCQKDPSLGI